MESLYVIKIGGNIIDDDVKLSAFLTEFAALDAKKILVHGGGKLATNMAEQMGIDQKLIDGRRITDAETLKVVTMVYAGYINKNIVAQLQSYGCNALGVCGADANILFAHRRKHPSIDYGFVGDIDSVNAGLISEFLSNNLTLVVAPLTHDGHGQLLNTNADTIAQEIAKTLSNEFDTSLIYSFEKSGVLTDINDDNSVIRELQPSSYKKLRGEEKITEGMIPKLDNAFSALKSGVKKVVIGRAEKLRELVNGHSGTQITNEQ